MSEALSDRVKYSDRLIQQIERDLRVVVLNNPRHNGLRLTRRSKQPGPEFFSAVGPSNITISYSDGKFDWNLVKAIRKGASISSVLVGCRIKFELEGDLESFYLVTVSVLVLSLRQVAQPLIRAEWDYRGIGTGVVESHGQPHWHMLAALKGRTEQREPFDVPQTFESDSWLAQDAESLHLAMATDWHEPGGETYQRKLPDTGSIRNWIAKTLKYSIGQVNYALVRSRGGAQSVRPFDAGT